MFFRNIHLILLAATIAFVYNTSAQATWKGTIAFTQLEKDDHARSIRTVVEAASSCLDADLAKQQSVFSQYGVSPFFGDRSSFAKLNDQDKLDVLYVAFQQLGHSQSEAMRLAQYFLKTMEPTSCVGLALKCLAAGFKAAGQEALWSKVKDYTDANNDDGTSMQNALQALGWRLLYWNPWTANNDGWDRIEHDKDPENVNRFWGYHAYRWNSVQQNMMYYFNKVDDASTLVNFGTRPPASFTRVPFFIGTAHTGYHVFPGHYGQVVEGHSTRLVTDSQTIQTAPFNPMADGGAPRGQYYSGLIAVPPGY